MTLKEATQDIVKQFSRVDRLQIERRFTAWLEAQHSLGKKPVSTVAVNAETAGAVNKVRAEFQLEQVKKIRIRDLSIVTAKVRPCAFTLDLDAAERSLTQKAVVARERQQTRDAR